MKVYAILALMLLSCTGQQIVASQDAGQLTQRSSTLLVNASSEQQQGVAPTQLEAPSRAHLGSPLHREINNLDNFDGKNCLKSLLVIGALAVGGFWAVSKLLPDKDFKDLTGPAL